MIVPVSWRGHVALLLGVVLAGLSTGCATSSGPLSASGKRIPPETLAAAEQRVADEQIPKEIAHYAVALYAEGRENQCLHAMRAGLGAFRLGRYDLAQRWFDEAILDVEALEAGARQADRAKSKFVREQEKWFKGESYERSALFFYRGALYLMAQDFGNSSACFKRAQLFDITGDDAPGFAGDWYSAEWSLAFASYKHGYPHEAVTAMERAAKLSTRPAEMTPPMPDQNALVLVETGGGPVKHRGGQYGEKLYYRPGMNPVAAIEVRAGQKTMAKVGPSENLFTQATTRGTRQVDHILAGKAAFKEGTGAAAVALATGAVIASHHDSRGGNIATGVLAGLAAVSAIASSVTTPEADIRAWDNLPATIYLVGLVLPPGKTELEIRGYDRNGVFTKTATVTVEVDGNPPVKVINLRF
jgi:tetratricopeptide (TPR) repeat protein